jgi:predicted DsbA family dithiol-disulfide isomerase
LACHDSAGQDPSLTFDVEPIVRRMRIASLVSGADPAPFLWWLREQGNVSREFGPIKPITRSAGVHPLQIVHFSDVLCVWAFFSEQRLAEVRRTFGDQVEFQYRFCPVFGDVQGKIATSWQSRGGYDGFADHVQHAGKAFPELTLHPDLWRKIRPASSLSPHLFLKAVESAEMDSQCVPGTFARALRMSREAFFVHGLDISRREIHHEIAQELGLDIAVAQRFLDDGRAHAALSADYKEAENAGVKGSPTMILNEGRQKLFGNVGYRIIEANIQELLREPNPDQASWC